MRFEFMVIPLGLLTLSFWTKKKKAIFIVSIDLKG